MGAPNENQKIDCKKWETMTMSKSEGGIGFRELEAFNLALLGKTVSRLMTEPNSQVRVIKGLYFPSSDFLQAAKGSRPSWAWRSMLSGRNVVQNGAVWATGMGGE